jgi:hypothetical protein
MNRPDRTLEAESEALGDDALGGGATDDGDRSRGEQAAEVDHGEDVS